MALDVRAAGGARVVRTIRGLIEVGVKRLQQVQDLFGSGVRSPSASRIPHAGRPRWRERWRPAFCPPESMRGSDSTDQEADDLERRIRARGAVFDSFVRQGQLAFSCAVRTGSGCRLEMNDMRLRTGQRPSDSRPSRPRHDHLPMWTAMPAIRSQSRLADPAAHQRDEPHSGLPG